MKQRYIPIDKYIIHIIGNKFSIDCIILLLIFFMCFGNIISMTHFNVANIHKILIIASEIVFTPKLDKSKINQISNHIIQPINIAAFEDIISSVIFTKLFLLRIIHIQIIINIGPTNFIMKSKLSII